MRTILSQTALHHLARWAAKGGRPAATAGQPAGLHGAAAALGSSVGLPNRYTNLSQLEADARPLLSPEAYGYFSSGSDNEWSLRENRQALERYRLLPRVLVDVSQVDTCTQLLGHSLSAPIIFAPMAQQRLCHPDGELAMARAATACGLPYVLSTLATSSIQEVADAVRPSSSSSEGCIGTSSSTGSDVASSGRGRSSASNSEGQNDAAADPSLWFQIYVMKRREATEWMVREVTRLGYKALVVTVDAPRLGYREADERHRFSLPPHLSLKNMEMLSKAAASTERVQAEGSRFGRHFSDLLDQRFDWAALAWLKTISPLPLLIKGVLAPDDARRAVELGVDGIIVSNHGGRQLNYAPAPIDVLPAVAEAVQGRVPLLVDGGISRGTDVIKCLALGAQAVLVGRPLLWALTLGGQAGVEEAVCMLQRELELSMALLGCASLHHITPDFLIPPRDGWLHIPAARR